MIAKKIQDAFCRQINAELYSAYLYLSMSANFESLNLPGAASWMRAQAAEELGHAMKFFTFVVRRGGTVTLDAIAKPKARWATPLAAFEDAYKHERKVTGMIDKLVDLAAQQQDHASRIFLEWFVTEQVEEEATAGRIVEQLRMIGAAKAPLLMLDRQLGARGASGTESQER